MIDDPAIFTNKKVSSGIYLTSIRLIIYRMKHEKLKELREGGGGGGGGVSRAAQDPLATPLVPQAFLF